MTLSIKPYSAAGYGVCHLSSYSLMSSFFFATGSDASLISLALSTATAPSAPITAISAVGQAAVRSAPKLLAHIAK